MARGTVNTSSVNLRELPNATSGVGGTLTQGTVVETMSASDDGTWLMVSGEADGQLRFGWVQAQFVTVDGAAAGPAGPGAGAGAGAGGRSTIAAPAAPSDDTAAILAIAGKSPIMGFHWNDRGVAPPAYINGMALTFAQAYRRFKAGHPAAIEMAKANTHNDERDALAWYNSDFAALGMTNDPPGADTLRHLFVLMLGVGMRESSGQHCCGRDQSASNTSAETAEAGLFQTSYNAHACHPQFDVVMDEFSAGKAEGYLSVFSRGVTCSQSNWANFGSGRGAEFQKLCKAQPAFAAESAAITLRNLRKHYGTVNRKEAELRKEADDLFRAVQAHVDQQVAAA